MANALQRIYTWAIPGVVVLGLAQSSIYDVRGGQRGIIFDRLSGVSDKVVNEGTHFLIPWLQRAILYDVRTKPRSTSSASA